MSKILLFCVYLFLPFFVLAGNLNRFFNQLPVVSAESNQITISIRNYDPQKKYFIYYRTENHKNFQLRKLSIKDSLLSVSIKTDNLDGKQLEYFLVEKSGAESQTSPLYTIENVNGAPLPEIYFQEEQSFPEATPPPSNPLISVSGSGSFSQRIYEKEESAVQSYNLNGNLRLFRNVYQEDGEFCFEATLSYLNPHSDIEKPINLTAMLIHFKAKNNVFEAGDLSINHTEFTTSSLNRRGIKYEHDGKNLYLNAFWVNSQQITGFDGFGLPESKSSFFGGATGFKLDERLLVRALFISGKDNLDSKTAWSSEPPFSSGSVFAFWLNASPFINNLLQINAEFARSNFGRSDSADSIVKESDNAWRAGVVLSYKFLNLNFDYQDIGENFNSITNLFLQHDRKGLKGGLGMNFSRFSLNFNYFDQKTNINNPLEDMLHQKKIDANISWTLSNSWRLGADFSNDNLDYDASTGKMTSNSDMTTTSYNGTISYYAGTMSINLTLGKRIARNFTSDFSGSLNVSLSLGKFLTLAPTISLQNQKNNATSEELKVFNIFLQSTINFIPDWFSLSANISFNSSKSSSLENKNISADGNLSLNLAKLFKQKINPLLSCRSQYQKATTAGVSSDNLKLWLQFDLSF